MAGNRGNARHAEDNRGLTGAVKSALGMLGSELGGEDALTLLKNDHREVEALFAEFEELEDGKASERRRIVQEVCALLSVHAALEEELFYPAVRRAGKEAQDLLDEADVEHGTVKELVARLEGMRADDRTVKANMTVLSEYVKHHVKEEENEIFAHAKDAGIDLDRLGREMEQRKLELMTQVAVERP
jgi:hemerythrin superfamily protein